MTSGRRRENVARMTHTVLLLALTLLAPARGPSGDDEAPSSSTPRMMVLPIQARSGASAYLGTGISEVLADALKHREELEVTMYDLVSVDMRDPALGVLARCPEVRCALELARRDGMDEAVYGILDGGTDPAILRIWRVDAHSGMVLGMFSTPLTEANLNRITDDPGQVVHALMDIAEPASPALRWQKAPAPKNQETSAAAAKSPAPRRENMLRTAGGVLLGIAAMGLGLGLAGMGAYTLLVVMNAIWSSRTHVNAVALPVGFALDLGGLAALLGVLISVPVGAAAAVALLAPAGMLARKGE